MRKSSMPSARCFSAAEINPDLCMTCSLSCMGSKAVILKWYRGVGCVKKEESIANKRFHRDKIQILFTIGTCLRKESRERRKCGTSVEF